MPKHQNQIDLPAAPTAQAGQLIASAIFRQSELRKAIDEIVADIEGSKQL